MTTRAAAVSMWTVPFALILAATFLYFITIGVLLPTLPIYVYNDLGGNGTALGLVVGAFGLAALLSRPLAGFIGDRRGRKPLLLWGAFVVAVSVAGYALARDVPTLAGMRLLTGFGEALFFVGALSVVSDLAPPSGRGRALTFFTIALYAALAIGPMIGDLVLHAAGFSAVWAVGCAAALASMFASLAVPETRPKTDSLPALRLVHPAAVLPGAVLLASVVGLTGFNTFVPIHTQAAGMSRSYPVFVTFALVLLLVRALFPFAPDRFGPARTATAALALSCAGMAALTLSAGAASIFIGTAVFAVGQALAFPALTAMTVSRVQPQERGAVLATFSGFLDLGFWLGPLMLGVVATHGSVGSVFAVSGVAAAIGLAALVIFEHMRDGRRVVN